MKRSFFARFLAMLSACAVLTAQAAPAGGERAARRAESAFKGFERAYANAGRAYRKHGPEGFMDALGMPMTQLDQVFLQRELGKLPKLPSMQRQGDDLVFEGGTRVKVRVVDADNLEYEVNGVRLKLDPRHGLERIVERLRQEAFAPRPTSLYDHLVPSAKADGINWGKIATIAIATLIIGAAVWWVGSKLIDKGGDKANEVVNNAADRAEGVIGRAGDEIDEKIDRVSGEIDQKVDNVSGKLDELGNRAEGLIDNVEGRLREAGGNLQGAIDEVKEEAEKLVH